jgi:hypothetical protein
MVAFKVDILLSEEKNEFMKDLSGFIPKFADDNLKIYLEASRTMNSLA